MGPRARRKLPPEAPILPETFLQCSGGVEFVVHATSDSHAASAFGGLVLLGPLRRGFSDCVGCRILPSIRYPGILIPNISVHKFCSISGQIVESM
jgi:hypothetical protein